MTSAPGDSPSGQEGVADGQEPFKGQRHGAVHAAHQPDLGHGDDDWQRWNANKLKQTTEEIIRYLGSRHLHSGKRLLLHSKWALALN